MLTLLYFNFEHFFSGDARSQAFSPSYATAAKKLGIIISSIT